MAKSFYTQDEACEKLDMTPEQLKDLVRNGSLREFRDAGKITYKVDEVNRLTSDSAKGPDAPKAGGDEEIPGVLSGSLGDFEMLSTGELTLEDSTGGEDEDALELRLADDDEPAAKAPTPKPPTPKPPPAAGKEAEDLGGSDSLSLELEDTSTAGKATEDDAAATSGLVLEPIDEGDSGIKLSQTDDADAVSLDDTTTTAGEKDDKDGTVVTSIGVSVFDEDDEIEQEADPLAQTVASGEADALGIDGVGSGSGLLDLTRESDDTSLGAELLDEIYPGGDEGGEMGDATRAGIEEAIPEGPTDASAGFQPVADTGEPVAAAPVVTRTRVEYAPDAVSTGLTGMLFVGVLVMCIAGLTAAAAVQGVWPAILGTLYSKNWIVGAASLGAALLALGIGYMVGKRSG